VRSIHYALLNNPPLRHAAKPESIYLNDTKSYKSLIDLLTRARLEGLVPMEDICDETRPFVEWNVSADSGAFVKKGVDRFLANYHRDLQQSQPNHIEIVGEKLTIANIINPVAGRHCIPSTIGRGYSSLPPRAKMAERYFDSGKEKLVIVFVTDHDPDGEQIAESFARSMRDDFDIDNIHPVKAALTADQVSELNLPASMDAKPGSSNYKKFVEKYGTDAYELEALRPEKLQEILRESILSILDTDMFNQELAQERIDAENIEGHRSGMLDAWQGMAGDEA
jgi:hypothetical protein